MDARSVTIQDFGSSGFLVVVRQINRKGYFEMIMPKIICNSLAMTSGLLTVLNSPVVMR